MTISPTPKASSEPVVDMLNSEISGGVSPVTSTLIDKIEELTPPESTALTNTS